MDTYSLLRELADSWVLLALFGFFVGAVLWAFRPAGGKAQGEARDIPFRYETAPRADEEASR